MQRSESATFVEVLEERATALSGQQAYSFPELMASLLELVSEGEEVVG